MRRAYKSRQAKPKTSGPELMVPSRRMAAKTIVRRRIRAPDQIAPGRSGRLAPTAAAPSLGLHASATLRERLIVEVESLENLDQVTEWARRSLPEKNRLRAPDAAQLEASFATKLAGFLAAGASENASPLNFGQTDHLTPSTARASVSTIQPGEQRECSRQQTIDKSVLALPESWRIRDRDHIRLVKSRPCLVCGRLPSDAHHLRFAQMRALSRKVSDEFTVPLCRGHHRELHRRGDEVVWWTHLRIDALANARALWLESHSFLGASTSSSNETASPSADATSAAIATAATRNNA
jgi:hypothetical protein